MVRHRLLHLLVLTDRLWTTDHDVTSFVPLSHENRFYPETRLACFTLLAAGGKVEETFSL